MKKDYIELKKCCKSVTGFKRGTEYIVLGEDDRFTYKDSNFNKRKCLRVVNEFGSIEVVIPGDMLYSDNRIIQSVKHVVYLGLSELENLEEGEVYSVFKVIEENGENYYTIFDGANKLKKYPTYMFISETQFSKMSKDEFQNYKMEKAYEINALDNARKEAKEKALNAKRELEKAKELSSIEADKITKVINVIKNNKPKTNPKQIFMDEAEKILDKVNSVSKLVVGLSCTAIIGISMLDKLLVSTVIGAVSMLASIAIANVVKGKVLNTINNNIIESNKPEEEYVGLMASFSDSILLKLKKVEVKLMVLERGTTINKETISLIKDSVSLCLDSYRVKDENLLNDIDMFLDKTLMYIDSLIDSDKTEEIYIEKQIYENVSSVINRNAQIFESMTSDNEKIKKILNR